MNQKNVNLSSNTIWTDKVQQDILSSIWVGILSLPVKLLVSSSKSTYATIIQPLSYVLKMFLSSVRC